ncbi:zinc dependent phospholipase C family protein [Spirochaetota bacterium]
MPGLITHFKVLKESAKYLSNRKKKTYLLRSIESLFSTEEHWKAAQFGSIGPNIFDYNLKKNKKSNYGNEISFFLHDGGSTDIISWMLNKVSKYEDLNNEWASIQRAYLYGYISHIICDSFLNPYIFYWSGFPDTYKRDEINHYRKQNLLFKYNMDNYFFYSDETNDLSFDINKFIPLTASKWGPVINPSVKSLILESINDVYPEIYKKIIWRKSKNEDKKFQDSFGIIDLVPQLIKFSYWVKRKKSKNFVNFINKMKNINFLFSDFIIQYPPQKKINRHVLNFHKERWQYPASRTGFQYESIDNIMEHICEKNVEIWEKIESLLYENKKINVVNDIDINAYTGVKGVQYHDMKLKNPVRLYF